MPTRLPTPPSGPPPLILCADGGGSKVLVVIRSEDGLEVRGSAGPCNVQSVGHYPGAQQILLATYRALSLLPRSHLPPDLVIPTLTNQSSPSEPSTPRTGSASSSPPALSQPTPLKTHLPVLEHLRTQNGISAPASPYASRPTSPNRMKLPRINVPLFQYVWLALAGISTPADSKLFMPHVVRELCVSEARVKITNDVNILAAPALDIPEVDHVLAVVCGTGTVGRTIKIDKSLSEPSTMDIDNAPLGKGKLRGLPLQDVSVARGWGYVLCDEGSAFWLGRLAIRSLLFYADRIASVPIYSSPVPGLLPLHADLLAYFGTNDPMALIDLTSLTGPYVEGLSAGEAVAKRNALVAGSARVVFKWAFPDEASSPTTASFTSPPSPPISTTSQEEDLIALSQKEALKLANKSMLPMMELIQELLGDGSVVKPERTVLSLGGGLWNSKGYRSLVLDGLKKEGVEFKQVLLVADPGGEGARGLARVEFE